MRFVKNDESVCWWAAISIAVSNKTMYLSNSRTHRTRSALCAGADAPLQYLLNDSYEWSISGEERSLLDIKIKFMSEQLHRINLKMVVNP